MAAKAASPSPCSTHFHLSPGPLIVYRTATNSHLTPPGGPLAALRLTDKANQIQSLLSGRMICRYRPTLPHPSPLNGHAALAFILFPPVDSLLSSASAMGVAIGRPVRGPPAADSRIRPILLAAAQSPPSQLRGCSLDDALSSRCFKRWQMNKNCSGRPYLFPLPTPTAWRGVCEAPTNRTSWFSRPSRC